ncbi:MAG: hypothetical protein MJB57_11395 [Gemmatimonadetes bacterium]|nr:hypothetical protein [Gemmatimonadota bacterium]
MDILIVVDGSITLDDDGFGLGDVIDLLESNEFYNWVEFRITGATREGPTVTNAAGTSKEFTYTGFRFTQSGFDIRDYDQVWLFGINPAVHNPVVGDDAQIDDTVNRPLTDAELEVLSRWMDEEQGGVFATGDHGLLGASMCHRVPRVGTMRKWTVADGVPSQVNFDRKDTNQRTPAHSGTIPFDAQSDDTPQPITVLKRSLPAYVVFHRRYMPHPVLCGVDGIIDCLPDHPHEGEVLGRRYDGTGGQPVDLTPTFSFDGYTAPEYPAGTGGHPQPEPMVIALGNPPDADIPHQKGPKDTSPFGLISVYDGEKAGIGRVLVDSTWHHWFNVNLEGFSDTSPQYKKIRNFFKNVAVWLSRKSLRDQMASALFWNVSVMHYDPMRFTSQGSFWAIGEEAKNVLGEEASACTITDWVMDFLIPELQFEFFEFPHDGPIPDPCLTCPPWDVVETAVLGGVFRRMAGLVERYRSSEQLERRVLDPSDIGESVYAGVREGFDELGQTLRRSLERTRDIATRLVPGEGLGDPSDYVPRIDLRPLSVRLEAIALDHPVLALLVRRDELSLSVEVRINEVITGARRVDITPDARTADIGDGGAVYIEVGEELLSDSFRRGDDVTIRLFLGSGDGRDHTSDMVWEHRLVGDPKRWICRNKVTVHDLLAGGGPVAAWLTIE